MTEYKCINKCCSITINDYKDNNQTRYNTICKKAGAFLYDENSKKILLVQSKGNFWGVPKGTFKKNENEIDCAIREVYEETSIQLNKNQLRKPYIINNNNYYYFVSMSECPVVIQNKLEDVNGIGWIKMECLKKMISIKYIELNYYTKLCIKKFLKIYL